MVMLPNSKPLEQWTAKEKSSLSPLRFLKIFLVPAIIFPFFAGFNPATYTESDTMPLIKPLVSLIYLIFENTVLVESRILFIITFYIFAFIASYIFLVIIFIPILYLISLISDKTNCFTIFPEGIAKGLMKNGVPVYESFVTWEKVHSYTFNKNNEFRLADRKNKVLMFVYFAENDEAKIKHYLNYYIKQRI